MAEVLRLLICTPGTDLFLGVALAATCPSAATIDSVYVEPPSVRKSLTTTAYEPVTAGLDVGDEGAEDVGVGAPAVGCEQAANRTAMPRSTIFTLFRTAPGPVGYGPGSMTS